MIRLEFRPANLHLQTDLSNGIRTVSREALETTFFSLPVRFNVHGIELFGKVSHDSTVFVCQVEQEMLEPTLHLEVDSPWSSVPILHLATTTPLQVRKACQGETAFYHLPGGGYLQFHPTSSLLEIYSSISQRSASTSCAELQKAFEEFKEHTLQFLIKEIPDLVEHPAWASWSGDSKH